MIKSLTLTLISLVHLCSGNKSGEQDRRLSNYRSTGCTINVNKDLSNLQPLIIHHNSTDFLYPKDKTGIVFLDEGQKFEICCTGELKFPKNDENCAIVNCVAKNMFEIKGKSYKFKEFNCKSIPEHIARKTGSKCFNKADLIEIGFLVEFGTRFIKVYEVCHNELTEETYFAKYQLTPGSAGFQKSYPRPSFGKGQFFGRKNVDKLYSRSVQRETIASLIGSSQLALKYIEKSGDIYLARGHLLAKSDCIYGVQQRSTFYFINTAPQWQRFNAQNWEAIESSTQKLASKRNIFLDVYTGTYGIMNLADNSGTRKEIFLDVNENVRKIPVPKFYYKILIDQAESSGIVFIGVNNPHLTLDEIVKDYIICTDVSNEIDYINWKKTDISRGYSYACNVNEFIKVVKHIPKLAVKKLLV